MELVFVAVDAWVEAVSGYNHSGARQRNEALGQLSRLYSLFLLGSCWESRWIN